MYKTNLLEKIDELTENFGDINIQKLEEIIAEILNFFSDFQKELANASQEEQKELIELASKLQTKLDQLATKASDSSGMNTAELGQFMNQPQNFSKEDWTAFKSLEKEITDYQKKMIETKVANFQTSKQPHTLKTGSKNWKKL